MDVRRWILANWDRVAAIICIALGAVALFLGWHGTSHTAYPAQQIPYVISGGIGGALLIALGAALLISADLRDEWRKLDRIERILSRGQADEHGSDDPSNKPPNGNEGSLTGVVGSRAGGNNGGSLSRDDAK